MGYRGRAAISLAWAFVAAGVFAQGDEGEGPGGPGETKAEKPYSEREKRILELFKASSKSYRDGKLTLRYDFESMNEDLVEDWNPTLAQAKPRIRWPLRGEGTINTIEHGIMIGDFGEWYHKAVFLAGVDVKSEMLFVGQPRAGSVLASVFYNERKKKSVGVSNGTQAVCLAGPRHAKPAIPPKESLPPVYQRFFMGFRYDGKTVETSFKGRKTADSSKSPKFADGIDTGHIGFAWSGSIQCFIFSIAMEGRLDPDWVAKQLGEKPEKAEKPEKPGKKGPEKSAKPAATKPEKKDDKKSEKN